MDRMILHADINNFFASVEIFYNPSLADIPMAVGDSEEDRHGIILAKNYPAKAFGIKTAESIWEARKKCPNLIIVPPHFEWYEEFMFKSRALMATYSDHVEPFGMDEAWLDISPYAPSVSAGEEIANELRKRFREEIGLTVSIGVSFNKTFAKLGSDMKKPDATTVITPENFRTKVWKLPVEEMLFVGKSTQEKLNRRGVMTIGELANTDIRLVHSWLGASGDMLHRHANGLDFDPVAALGSESAIKSLGNSHTPPRDLYNERDALSLLQALSETVAERLRRHRLLAETVVLSIRDSNLITFERQTKLARPSCISIELRNAAFKLLRENYDWNRPIRSLGIRTSTLSPINAPMQLSLFSDEMARDKRLTIETTIDAIRKKHGKGVLSLATASYVNSLGKLPDNETNPLAVFKMHL